MLEIAPVLGAVGGLGVFLVVREMLPTEPNLQAALERLSTQRPTAPVKDTPEIGLGDRLGLKLHSRAGTSPLLRVPTRDLALLRLPAHRWLGEKILLALIGLMFPPVAAFLFAVIGLPWPIAVPVGGSLLLGVVFFHIPNYVVKDKAAKAREGFARSVGAYIELVALERAGGTGTRQSLENAAHVASSWPFQRIREELLRASMSGQTPWTGLDELSDELGVPQLKDLADIMRRAGEDDAQIYQALRARGRSLRTELLTAEQTRANALSEQMVMPAAAMAMIFVALLAAPAAFRIL